MSPASHAEVPAAGEGPPGRGPLPPASAVAYGGATGAVRQLAGPAGGPTVLLLHGLTATADLGWFSVWTVLEGRYRGVAPDMRGHGEGPPPALGLAAAGGLRPFVSDAASLIDELGLDDIIVCGYSMGGLVAQELWRRRQRQVRGLVLSATSSDFRPRGVHQRLESARRRALVSAAARSPRAIRCQLARRIGHANVQATSGAATAVREGREVPELQVWAEAQLRRNDALGVLAAATSLRRHSTTSWVGEIDVPVAVIIPTGDTTVSPPDQLRLMRDIPGATLHEVEGGHGVFVEEPDRYAETFAAALASVVRRLA